MYSKSCGGCRLPLSAGGCCDIRVPLLFERRCHCWWCPSFCALWFSPVPVVMISSLLVRSHRALTCRGSVASTIRWGRVADSRAYGPERAVAIGEAAHDAGAASDLPVRPFDHVVGADATAMLARVVVEQVGRRLADALPEASGGLLEFPRFHALGGGFRLLQCLVPGFHGEHGQKPNLVQTHPSCDGRQQYCCCSVDRVQRCGSSNRACLRGSWPDRCPWPARPRLP